MATKSILSFHSVAKSYGGVPAVISLDLEVREGEFLTLLGPSGCGKTTTLRMAGGFEVPAAGEVRIDGQVVNHLPPHKRQVNTVFQDYALFPHMTVFENIAYGLRVQRMTEAEINRRLGEMMEMVELRNKGRRRPAELSGGERQRVALARALVNHPRILLLDEPLGALDANLRKNMQRELKAIHQRLGLTFVYVTHDQEEALFMSDRVGVMCDGRLIQLGTPQEVYDRSASRFVANFLGFANLLAAEVAELNGESATVRIGDAVVSVARGWCQGKGPATAVVRPERVRLATERPATGNALPGQVVESHYLGRTHRYLVRLPWGGELTAEEPVTERPTPLTNGSSVFATWVPSDAYLLAGEG